jgi:hypothetical protein
MMRHYSPSPRWLAVPGIGFPQNISVGPNALDAEDFRDWSFTAHRETDGQHDAPAQLIDCTARIAMSTYCAVSKRKVRAWKSRQLTSSTASSASNRWPVVRSPTNIWKFIINLPGVMVLTAVTAVVGGDAVWQAARAQAVTSIDARVIAENIPGASAISQVGTFLNNPPPACARPIPTLFPTFTVPGAVLDPNRVLVGSQSNFGAPLPMNVGQEGSFLSIDPSGSGILSVPRNFAESGVQSSTLGGAVQMFSANSPHWLNGVNNLNANTANYTGVSNPLGLSNNNAFGRLWPANAPFGDAGVGSSSILDPTGLPLKGPPNKEIGGVYVGDLTDRDKVAVPQQPQVIKGSLKTGAVGTAFLGPSPDGSCKAVFSVVTADGAIVQEHTLKGLDGLAPAGTVQPLLGRSWDPPNQFIEPRLGVLMNPYNTQAPVVQQLFVSEPFNNTIAVINLVVVNGPTPNNQVFGLGSVSRISSPSLNLPVDLAAVQRDVDNFKWASNTTLDDGSDFYVANRGNNTIVRMQQDGTVVAVRRVSVGNNASLNGITTSTDGKTIYVTVTGPGNSKKGGVLALPAF